MSTENTVVKQKQEYADAKCDEVLWCSTDSTIAQCSKIWADRRNTKYVYCKRVRKQLQFMLHCSNCKLERDSCIVTCEGLSEVTAFVCWC